MQDILMPKFDPSRDPKRDEVCELYGLSRSQLRAMVKKGQLAEYKISYKDVRVTRESLDRWLEELAQSA